nr:hypothetical protein [Tanacetum cinerariifolium]
MIQSSLKKTYLGWKSGSEHKRRRRTKPQGDELPNKEREAQRKEKIKAAIFIFMTTGELVGVNMSSRVFLRRDGGDYLQVKDIQGLICKLGVKKKKNKAADGKKASKGAHCKSCNRTSGPKVVFRIITRPNKQVNDYKCFKEDEQGGSFLGE